MRDRPVQKVLREEARTWAASAFIIIVFWGLKWAV